MTSRHHDRGLSESRKVVSANVIRASAFSRKESLRGNHLAGVLIATRKAIKQALSLAN